MTLASFTFVLFAAFSSIRIFSYVPQIRKVASDTNGASAISYSTWGLWAAANIATGLYALVNLGDTYLASVSALYAACCFTVIALTAAKRRNLAGPRPDAMGERASLVQSLRNSVHEEAAALLSGSPRNPGFEREFAAHSRRILYHDLMTYLRLRLRLRLRALGRKAGEAMPRDWRLRPR
jgi:hypothetical protein